MLIAARRLTWLGMDRPAAALLGAVACVALGVLSPQAALHAVDGDTLLLLFGVMGMGAFLALDGFFEHVEARLVARARTPARLLGFLVWGAGGLSALVTNDAVCVLGAPLVVRMVQRQRLPALPFLLALATAANTGSVATLVGNPQNMLCGVLGGLTYRDHLLLMLPVAGMGLAVNHAILAFAFRRDLSACALQTPADPGALPRRARVTVAVVLGTSAAYMLGGHLAWTATTALVVLMLLHRRDTHEIWKLIDWSLLLFFGGLFVVVEGLVKSGVPDLLFARFPLAPASEHIGGWLSLSGLFLIGSNLVSNVPFILVVRDQVHALEQAQLGWELLAMASTFAGNMTLLGSAANIIVAEAAHEVGGVGFWPYLRVGLPLSLITTVLGTLWVVWAF